MSFSVLYIILIATILVSLKAMKDDQLLEKMLYIPYKCKHENQFYRMFSHMLIHADGQHLLFNMVSLYFLGRGLEQEFIFFKGFLEGEMLFLSLYVLGGLFSTLIPFMRNKDNPSYRSLGASGAVSAVVFGFVVLNPMAEIYVFFIPMKAWLFGILYLGFELFAFKKGGSGIAHDAHIGGAVFGVFFVALLFMEQVKQVMTLDF